jgi:Holliday junction resolvasome RuvABC endonuclease subunit
MQIISLDLGTKTGWCAGDTGQIGVIPEWGCWQLAGARDLNSSFVGLYNELSDLIDRKRPKYVVYETPLTQSGRDSSRNVVDLLVGLAAVARLTCLLCQVEVYEQTFAEARKLVVGRGTFPKPFRGVGRISHKTGKLLGDAKEEVRLWIEQYGWGAIDDPDARDAAVLFRFAQMISRTRAAA